MKNLKKTVLVFILTSIILVLSVTHAVCALGVTATITVGTNPSALVTILGMARSTS